jgi:hypothetical protein
MAISSPYDFITKNSQLMSYIFGNSTKQPAISTGSGRYNLPSGVNVPRVNLPDVELPTIQGPNINLNGPNLPPVSLPNLPQVDLPKLDLPNIGLPGIKLPDLNLPKFDLPQVPLPSTGGIGYNNGQITYNPTPEQAIRTGVDLANIAGQPGIAEGLGQFGAGISNVLGPATLIWSIGSALDSVFGNHNWTPATAEQITESFINTIANGPDPSNGNTREYWARLTPEQQAGFRVAGENKRRSLAPRFNLSQWNSIPQNTQQELIAEWGDWVRPTT